MLIAGPNGSGKSSGYEMMKAEGRIDEHTIFINPDVYAKAIANKGGYANVNVLPPKLKTAVDIEAGKIALTFRDKCLKNRQNFIVETTASSRGTIKLIDQAKENGFIVDTCFVTLKSAELNNLRIQQRVAAGGHFVEPDIVKRRFEKSMRLMPEVLAKSDSAKLVDNSNQFEVVLTLTSHQSFTSTA